MTRRTTTGRPAVPAQQTQHTRVGAVEVTIAVDHCVGCLACADVCQPDALEPLPDVFAVGVDIARCTGCRRCVDACPFGVISVIGGTRNRHQIVVDNLRNALASSCPAGWRVTTTGPAFWTSIGQPTIVPDLAVVLEDRAAAGWSTHERASVPLVVEVVAPSTKDMDLGRKRDLYWQRDVATYWTVDQRTGGVTVHWSLHRAWFDRWAAFPFA